MADDDEWAEAAFAQLEAGEQIAPAADPNHIGHLHYTPEVAYLSLIADRVLAVRSAVFTVQSDQQERPLPTLPRPQTALERVRERYVISELLEVERQLFGGGLQVDT